MERAFLKRGFPFLMIVVLMAILCPSATRAFAAEKPRLGEFETTFTDRGTNTAPPDLAKRFGMRPDEARPDYDLAAVHLQVYVPADYDPAAPMGLIVLLDNHHVDAAPPAIKPVCDQAHLIFVALKDPGGLAWQKAGWLINIAENLQKQYAIDKNRIYLIDVEENNFVPFAVADLYTGHISTLKFIYNGRVAMQKGAQRSSFDPHDQHKLDPKLVAIAKRRAYFFTINPAPPQGDIEASRPFTVQQMARDGYQHVRSVKVDPADSRFPEVKEDWLKQAITWLDITLEPGGHTARVGPATATSAPAADVTAPATAPAQVPVESSEEAARLLKVARLYVSSKRKDTARFKLNEIIKKYPNDPSAAAAKELLDKLGD